MLRHGGANAITLAIAAVGGVYAGVKLIEPAMPRGFVRAGRC